MKVICLQTFCANSEQQESLHLLFDLVCVAFGRVGAVSAVGVDALLFWMQTILSTVSGWQWPDAIESEWINCGVLVFTTLVKPLNGPFGESPVTTTDIDGARTRRGLKMAAISPSLGILLMFAYDHLQLGKDELITSSEMPTFILVVGCQLNKL